jgi:hypothetical protein
MFGIDDPGIWLAYLGVFGSVAFGIYYGIRNWNKGAETDPAAVIEDVKWEEKDEELKHDIAD